LHTVVNNGSRFITRIIAELNAHQQKLTFNQ
jgi:hypothetical protein